MGLSNTRGIAPAPSNSLLQFIMQRTTRWFGLLFFFAMLWSLVTVTPALGASHNATPDVARIAARTMPPPPSPNGLSDPRELETFLDGVLAEQLADDHIPGATVAVVKDGRLFFAKGYGYADLQHSEQVNAATTLFRVGSVSKLFTWTAVMQLAEEGKVNLHADINTYLKAFQIPATYPQPITLAHLLTHTAGFEENNIETLVPTARDLKPLGPWLATHIPARVRPPGVLAAYSNYGAALAGYIVEQVSGMPFDQYIEQHIYKPLNMSQSTFRQPVPSNLAPHLSQGYTAVNGTYRADPFEDVQVWPAGSMSATATDMANFMIAHLQDGRYGTTRILQAATAQDMHQQHFTHDPRLPGMAYGFYEQSINNLHLIAHGGDTVLFHTLLALLPSAHVGLFVSYNSRGGATARDTLLQAFLDRYFPTPKVPLPQSPAGFNERANQISGSYLTTRRNYTTYEKLLNLFTTANVSTAGDGHLVITGAAAQTLNVVEVAPWVFRQVGGPQTVIFQMSSNGTTMLVSNLPIMAFTKAAWYDTPNFHFLLILVCLLLFLSAVLLWPLGFLRNIRVKREGKRASGDSRPLLIHVLAGVVSGLDILFVVGLALLLSTNLEALEFSVPPMFIALLILAMISSVLTVGVILSTVLVWRRHFWAERSAYTIRW